MLKATFNSKYLKGRNTMYTYKVTGTAAELLQYCSVQEASSNKAPGTWPKLGTLPLFFVNVTSMVKQGNTPELNYLLIFNQDNTRVFLDNSAAELQDWVEIKAAKLKAVGDYQARIILGIDRPQTGTVTVAAPAVAGATNNEQPDLLDDMKDKIGEGLGADEHVDAGTESLAG